MKKIITTIILILPFAFSLSAQVKKKTAAPVKAATSSVNALASITRGKAVYAQSCIACHQADGGGVQGLNPPLSKTEYVLGDKNRLINIVLKGLNKDLEIDGDVYSNPMPPLNYLTDQQVADVLTYVRNSFQNKASAVTVAQVKAARAQK